jgi:thymidylate synthase (FAD)
MNIIAPSYTIMTPIDGPAMLRTIEAAARTCYKSEAGATPESAPDFVRKLVHVRKHESVIEHVSVSVRFVIDRGVSHELVRHRLAAFSQESTRYCNYSADKFGHEITVIQPPFWPQNSLSYLLWQQACEAAEMSYFSLLNEGASPQQARSVLPNSLKTEVVMTANLREWRHVLRLRASAAAHPQMQQIMRPLLIDFKTCLGPVFDDINP